MEEVVFRSDLSSWLVNEIKILRVISLCRYKFTPKNSIYLVNQEPRSAEKIPPPLLLKYISGVYINQPHSRVLSSGLESMPSACCRNHKLRPVRHLLV